jgi:hypothetical protein
MTIRWKLLSLAACPFLCSSALAHHSRVEYNRGEIYEFEGEVVRVVWRSPHVMFTVREQTDDGPKDWVLEGPGAGTLLHEGLVDGHVAVGDQVMAAGQRSSRRDDWLRLANIMTPDGPELVFAGGARWSENVMGGDAPPTAHVASGTEPDGIFRVWVWRGGTPYDVPELPPLQPDALAAYQAHDPLRDDPALECDLPGMPRVMTIAGSRPFEIMRDGDNIRIHSMNYNQIRTIHMNSDVEPDSVEASKLGFSQGRWEGETLVVETTRISWPHFDLVPWWGIPQTVDLDIVERFTLEGESLVYDFWAYDPNTFTEPVDRPRALVWTWEPGLEVTEDNCVPYYENG